MACKTTKINRFGRENRREPRRLGRAGVRQPKAREGKEFKQGKRFLLNVPCN